MGTTLLVLLLGLNVVLLVLVAALLRRSSLSSQTAGCGTYARVSESARIALAKIRGSDCRYGHRWKALKGTSVRE